MLTSQTQRPQRNAHERDCEAHERRQLVTTGMSERQAF